MNTDKHGLLRSDLTEPLIRLFYEVYNDLGHGFLESVSERALSVALTHARIPHATQRPLVVRFRGEVVGDFRADIVVNEAVLLEIKAARTLDPSHDSQVLNYLRGTNLEIGLLLNFGPKPQVKRFLFDNPRKSPFRVHPC